MKVILLEDVKSLGKKGEIVTVSDAYARNVIFAKKLGLEATGKNLNDLKLQNKHADKVAQEQLEAAKALAKELEDAGVEVILTRTGDEGPGQDQAEAGSRKLADLKARTERINEEYPDLAVSIHQNSYPDPSVRGVQVFYYSRSEAGERMAALMEKAFREGLPEETRVRDSKANEEYYLLRNTEVPAIILECGFLSCPEELSLLMDQDYQEQFCKAAARGILACMGK